MISKLKLQNFRNHKKAEFEFLQKNIILGENGSGKSNILEAIYMLSSGKSFKADRDEEIKSYGEEFFRVTGEIGEMEEIGVVWGNGRKKFEVNQIPKRMVDFAGKLTAVLFGPQDLELVTGSPGVRRRYLDFVISQKNREYRRDLVSYEKGLRQRNRLLEMIREGEAHRSQLYFWDKLLIKNGEYITTKRREYLETLNSNSQIHKIIYDKSVISETRLKQYETEEVAAGTTLVGPHRDNFIVTTSPLTPLLNSGEGNWRDVSKFGSRGEQRMAVLWLKEGEIKYLSHITEVSPVAQQPVLLLDDIFSELDHQHREEVERILDNQLGKGGQVIMTSADKHMLPEVKGWTLLKL